jgi:3-deoxy-7-phosphoheptulonate synthase
MTGFPKVSNRRVRDMRPLIPPQILLEELPLTSMALDTVAEGRLVIENILSGADDRLLVIVGCVWQSGVFPDLTVGEIRPCSIHDLEAAKDYAHRLRSYAELAKDDLHVVMRVSFER